MYIRSFLLGESQRGCRAIREKLFLQPQHNEQAFDERRTRTSEDWISLERCTFGSYRSKKYDGKQMTETQLYVLVIVDRFTKWVELIVVKNTTAETTLKK